MIRSTILAMAAIAMVAFMPAASSQAGGIVSPGTFSPKAVAGDNLVEKVGRRHRRRLAVGAGIVTLGILGAIAADRAYGRPHYYDRYQDRRWQCRRWRRSCNNGNDRACWRFDTRC